MKQYWNNLQPRERLTLIAGAAALLLLLLYAAVIDPYQARVERLEKQAAAQRADLEWMRQAATQVRALRAGAPRRSATGQSLLALADSTAKAQGLGSAVKRVQPEGQGSVRVWMEQASFDDVLRWLQTLTNRHGVRISALVADPSDEAGRADVRLVLESGT